MVLSLGAQIVTRFAPSPTGHLHLGHAHSALLGSNIARETAGRFLLRIEDIDRVRCRPEFEAAIFEDLTWLGLQWEQPVRRQSDHFDDYRDALGKLERRGVLYPCFCSRKDIAAAASAPQNDGDAPVYPGTCRHLDPILAAARMQAGDAYALRLDVAKALRTTGPLEFRDAEQEMIPAHPERLGDVVLGRRDAPAGDHPSYHLCATLDDHLQGVTLVVRGVDLEPSTHIHRLLQALLGLASPQYRHHLLLTNESGIRLSKRDGAQALRALRAKGLSAGAVRAMAGFPDA